MDMSPKISHKTLGANRHNAVRTTGLLVHVGGWCGSILARILGVDFARHWKKKQICQMRVNKTKKMKCPRWTLHPHFKPLKLCVRNGCTLHVPVPRRTHHWTFTVKPGVADAFQHIIHIVHRCFGKARDTTSSILIDSHIQLLLQEILKGQLPLCLWKEMVFHERSGSCNSQQRNICT